MSPWMQMLPAAWQELQWHWPWVLPLAALPLLWMGVRHRRRIRMARYADPHLQPWAVGAAGWSRAQAARFWAEAAGWALLVIALAGPRQPGSADASGPGLSRSRANGDIVVLVQVSDSMRSADLSPDRLTRARLALQDGLGRLRGERLTLIAYGARAGMLLPPTRDSALFGDALQWLDADLLPGGGSNLAQALALALRQSGNESPPDRPTGRQSGRRQRALLLITDAAPDSLDGEQGAAVERYRALSKASGGRTAYLDDDGFGWNSIYTHGIGAVAAPAGHTGQGVGWNELFGWPLGLGAALLLLAYTARPRWRLPHRAPLAVCMVLVLSAGAAGIPRPARAQPAPSTERRAWEAYSHGQWALARRLYEKVDGYRGHWGAGLAALRDGSAVTAVEQLGLAWTLAPDENSRLDALYNLAYAYAVLGRWEAAAEGWQAVLDRRPSDTRALANLRVAREQLRLRQRALSRRQDLYGHRGFAVEGTVGPDGADPTHDIPEPKAGPIGTTTGGGAEGAPTPPGPSAARPSFVATQRDLESARIKLGRLAEQRKELQKALIGQDANVPLPTSPGDQP